MVFESLVHNLGSVLDLMKSVQPSWNSSLAFGVDFGRVMPRRAYAGDGEGAEGEGDGWNDQQEAAFQEEKQLAYEVMLTSNVWDGHFCFQDRDVVGKSIARRFCFRVQ